MGQGIVAMKLQHFTAHDDGERITRVAFVVADHLQELERKESIDAVLKTDIDLPVVRNGALLRAEVLRKAAEKLAALAEQYETAGRTKVNRTSP
jgi:hypothetical protein